MRLNAVYVRSPSVLSVCSDFVLPAFSLGLFLCVVGLFIILDTSRWSL